MSNKLNIIFDLDGTLADTAVLTMKAFENLAHLYGLPVPSMETIRRAMGYQNPEFYNHIYPNEPEESVRLLGERVETEEQRLLPAFKADFLFPGVRELLAELKILNYPMHIASTGSEDHVYSILNKEGIKEFFTKVVCDKPVKTGMIAEIIGSGAKEDFIMVGDMKKDIEGAKANGIIIIGACYGYAQKDSGFDMYIDTPAELLDIIKNIEKN